MEGFNNSKLQRSPDEKDNVGSLEKLENPIIGYTRNLNEVRVSGQHDNFSLTIENGKVTKTNGYLGDLKKVLENYSGGYIPIKKYSESITDALKQETHDLPEGAEVLSVWQQGEVQFSSASPWSLALELGDDYSSRESSRIKELGLEYPFTETELRGAWEKAPEHIKYLNPYKSIEEEDEKGDE